jgi:hypothetical protein
MTVYSRKSSKTWLRRRNRSTPDLDPDLHPSRHKGGVRGGIRSPMEIYL